MKNRCSWAQLVVAGADESQAIVTSPLGLWQTAIIATRMPRQKTGLAHISASPIFFSLEATAPSERTNSMARTTHGNALKDGSLPFARSSAAVQWLHLAIAATQTTSFFCALTPPSMRTDTSTTHGRHRCATPFRSPLR